MDKFHLHSAARLIGPDGHEEPLAVAFDPLPPAFPGTRALAAILAGDGAAFRIGGQGGLEAGPGEFETLTGGSLGAPRRVIRSQASWCRSFSVNAGLFGIGPGRRVAVLGELVHSLALYGAVEGLVLGADVHLLEHLRPDRQARVLQDRGIEILYATPAQLRPVASAAQDLPDLRHVVVGGAKLDAGLRERLAKAAPQARVTEFYGAAETSFVTLAGPEDDQRTVGQPYPGVDLEVDDSGRVWVKSPYLFRAYAGNDPGGAQWRDGWLCVGEMGEKTPAGLVLRGRAGRMVTVADRNVFPEEIEQFLLSLPGISRAAVVPVVDRARGNVLVAYLQGDENHASAVGRALRQKLGATIAPRRLVWRGEWPLLPSGKTDLAALQREAVTWR